MPFKRTFYIVQVGCNCLVGLFPYSFPSATPPLLGTSSAFIFAAFLADLLCVCLMCIWQIPRCVLVFILVSTDSMLRASMSSFVETNFVVVFFSPF